MNWTKFVDRLVRRVFMCITCLISSMFDSGVVI